MKQYLDLLRTVRDHGEVKTSRAALADGTHPNTRSLFGAQLRFDLRAGFPLVTTKRVPWKSVAVELLWFLRGSTNVAYLHEHNVTIWDEWADEDGELGPVYGKQWRAWPDGNGGTIDQLALLIEGLKHNPDGRRHILSSWNVADLARMKLPPCHLLTQFYVSRDRRLSCQLYQRSADMFLGVPFNIASYALLTHMIASVCDLAVGDFVHTFGDAHIYENHLDVVDTQLARTPHALPTLTLDPEVRNIDDFRLEHLQLTGYTPDATLRGEVAV
jgi:thymidylate synthase